MKSAFDLSGRRILITGAADGIGAATAAVCARLGAEVILVDLLDAEFVAAQIREAGGQASSLVADVSTRAAAEQLAGIVDDLDGLVLNAAVCPWDDDWDAPSWDTNFDRVIAVNVLGPVHLARVFLPAMIRRQWGRMVFVGSLAGRTGGLIAGAALCRLEGRRSRFRQMAGASSGASRRIGQRRRAGLGRDSDDDGPAGRPRAYSSGAQGESRGGGLADRIPVLGRGQLHLRRRARRERRRAHGMMRSRAREEMLCKTQP